MADIDAVEVHHGVGVIVEPSTPGDKIAGQADMGLTL